MKLLTITILHPLKTVNNLRRIMAVSEKIRCLKTMRVAKPMKHQICSEWELCQRYHYLPIEFKAIFIILLYQKHKIAPMIFGKNSKCWEIKFISSKTVNHLIKIFNLQTIDWVVSIAQIEDSLREKLYENLVQEFQKKRI